MTIIVNKRVDDYDVYIGRGSPFGNPFKIGQNGDRNKVIGLYRIYIYGILITELHARRMLTKLRDKRLGCYCKPLDCHGDVLKEFLDTYTDKSILRFHEIKIQV